MTEKITILVEKPLTYLEMMHGGSWVFRNRKLIEVQVDPITLPYGLWERAEAKHKGETPVKKKDKTLTERVLAIKWDHEIRKNWYKRNGLVMPDA